MKRTAIKCNGMIMQQCHSKIIMSKVASYGKRHNYKQKLNDKIKRVIENNKNVFDSKQLKLSTGTKKELETQKVQEKALEYHLLQRELDQMQVELEKELNQRRTGVDRQGSEFNLRVGKNKHKQILEKVRKKMETKNLKTDRKSMMRMLAYSRSRFHERQATMEGNVRKNFFKSPPLNSYVRRVKHYYGGNQLTNEETLFVMNAALPRSLFYILRKRPPKLRFSAKRARELPHTFIENNRVKEIVVVGATNVGKSAFIRKVINAPKEIKVSTKIGTTQNIDVVDIENTLYITDTPGYGFSFGQTKLINRLEETKKYILLRQKKLAFVNVLVDARHGLRKTDKAMMQFLEKHRIPFRVMMNKGDLVDPKHLAKMWQFVEQEVYTHCRHVIRPVYCISSRLKSGIVPVQNMLMQYMTYDPNDVFPKKFYDQEMAKQERRQQKKTKQQVIYPGDGSTPMVVEKAERL